jgi:alkylation response protein AidB-like acyl-CoA dehydrogenase
MNFEYSEEQQMLKTMARDFLETECPESFIREMLRGDEGYSPDQWRKIADLGWLGMPFPEQYGGTGSSILDLVVLYEEMGRALFPSPHLSTVILSGLTILDVGTDEQKTEFLTKIAKGEIIIAFALTEPDACWGPDAWEAKGVTVPATADGDDYVINGTKLFVHDAHIADYLLCATRTKDSGAPEGGVTLFLVDAKSPGISCTVLKTTAGDKQSEVVFNKVKVPKKSMVGKLNGGWEPVRKAIQRGAMMLCAEMVGAGEKLLEISVDYAKTRIQFESPIAINQQVQEMCVQMLIRVSGSRNLTHLAAWKMTENMPCDYDIALASAWTCDGYDIACLMAHDVHAGVGYMTKDHVLPLYDRKSKTQGLYLGDSAYWRGKMADTMDDWTYERPNGKPLGIWDKPLEEQVPDWSDVWSPESIKAY